MITCRWLLLRALLFGLEFFLSLSPSESQSSSTFCTVCPNPRHSITLPDQPIPLFGTCGALNASISIFQRDSDICRLVQSVSTLCGCRINKSSCFLCNHNYNGSIYSSKPVPYLLDVPGVNVTCDIVQAYLHSIPANNSTCTLIKGLVGPYCGCPSSLTGSSNSDTGVNSNPCSLCKSGQPSITPNKTINSGLDLPFLKTCGDLENVAKTYWQDGTDTCRGVQSLGTYCGCPATNQVASCTFCSDGSSVTMPNQTLPFLKSQFNLAGIDPTCGLVDAAIQSLSSTDPLCSSVRLLGSYCGCPAIPNHCYYCPKPGDHFTDPNKVIRQFGQISGLTDVTCGAIYSTQYQVPNTSDTCWKTQSKNYLCGCNNGKFDYFGADTDAKRRVLAWMPRISAMLSLSSSLFILTDIYRHHRNPLDQYHELVASISFFDIIGSSAVMFTTLPIPPYDDFGQPSGIYGAHGTKATCKAQGFFFQLGFTGIFYNLALSIYYVLVVNYRFRDSDLKKIRMWFHLPFVVGLALACAGIPYYENYLWICHVPSPPINNSYRYINSIALFPIMFVIALSAIAMWMVYIKVLRQSRTSNRWRFGNGGGAGGKLARKVFWQAFFFVVALYGSWPIIVLAEYSGNNRRIFNLYWFWVIALSLPPLQGFFNFFVYTRPKMLLYLKRRRRQRQQQSNEDRQRTPSWARFAMRISMPKNRRNRNTAATATMLPSGNRVPTKATIEEEANSFIDPPLAGPMDVDPSNAASIDIDPSHTAPIDIDPSHTAPVDIDPSNAAHVDIDPSHTAPVGIDPSHAAHNDIDPSHAAHIDIDPSRAAPVDTDLSHATPVDTDFFHTAPVDTGHSHAAPVDTDTDHSHTAVDTDPDHSHAALKENDNATESQEQ